MYQDRKHKHYILQLFNGTRSFWCMSMYEKRACGRRGRRDSMFYRPNVVITCNFVFLKCRVQCGQTDRWFVFFLNKCILKLNATLEKVFKQLFFDIIMS